MTERACQRAANLARDAQRAATFLRDIDRLDLNRPARAARRKAEQPFAGAVGRNLFLDDFRTGDRETGVERCPEVTRNVRHVGKVGDTAHIEPVPELLHAHPALLLRHADLAQRLGETLARQADQRSLLLARRLGRNGAPGWIRQVDRKGHLFRSNACGAAQAAPLAHRPAINTCPPSSHLGGRAPDHLHWLMESSAAEIPRSEKT